MVKEDRSDWVAVEGEHANIGDKIVKGAKSAWFFFQKNNTTKIKQEVSSSNRGSYHKGCCTYHKGCCP